MATNLTIEDLDNGKLDLITLEEVSNVDFTGDTTQNRNSDTILTLSGAIKLLGFQPAVAHAAGITFLTLADITKTIEENGIIYGILAGSIPFTTTASFAADVSNFFVVQVGALAAQPQGVKSQFSVGSNIPMKFYCEANINSAGANSNLRSNTLAINTAIVTSRVSLGKYAFLITPPLISGSANFFHDAQPIDDGLFAFITTHTATSLVYEIRNKDSGVLTDGDSFATMRGTI